MLSLPSALPFIQKVPPILMNFHQDILTNVLDRRDLVDITFFFTNKKFQTIPLRIQIAQDLKLSFTL